MAGPPDPDDVITPERGDGSNWRTWIGQAISPAYDTLTDAIDWVGAKLPQASPEVQAHFKAAQADADARVAATRASLYNAIPEPVKQIGRGAVSYAKSLYDPGPQLKAGGELLTQQLGTLTPETGVPVIDWTMAPQRLANQLGSETLTESTTPVGAVLNADLPLGKLAAVAAKGGVGGLAMAVPPRLSALAQRLFPKVDAYGKPAPFLSEKTALKRLEGAADLTPEDRAGLTQLVEQIRGRRVAPAELHALAAGESYTPDRVVRKVKAPVEGAKQIKGAPLGVTNPRQERALRERYLGGMEEGVGGRDWYHDAGEAILFHANDDPARARLVANDLAITSPTTSVGANTGFGVKGYNQATAGVPVEAGRFPTAMGKSIQEVHAGTGGTTGQKRIPFAENLARGGGFQDTAPDAPTRAVHDIWDAEGWGYVNPDGTPMRTGFGPAQHRWMDTQQDKAIAMANQRELGGFTNWDELRSQAAQWTGQQIRAGVLKPEDAAKSYADYFAKLYAQGSRESMPGKTTGHMPELFQPEMDPYRRLYNELVLGESGIYDPQMRDQLAAGYGGLVGRSFQGPGVFEGQISPGVQTQVLTGSLEVPGGRGRRMLDEGSRRIMDAAEATHGLLLGQDASAYSRLLPAGTGAARTGWDVTLPGGTISPEQMRQALAYVGAPTEQWPMILVPTPDGVRLGGMPPDVQRGLTRMLGGKVKEAGAAFDENTGNFFSNDWRQQPVGQGYFDKIRTMGSEKFDRFAPAIASRLRDIDARFQQYTRGRVTLSPMLDEVRGAIANEGFAGLERLAKKYGIPVALLMASLNELGEAAAGQGGPPPS